MQVDSFLGSEISFIYKICNLLDLVVNTKEIPFNFFLLYLVT